LTAGVSKAAHNLLLTVLAVIVSLGHVVCSTPAVAAPTQSSSAHHFRAEEPSPHAHSGSHADHDGASDHSAPCHPADGPCVHCASAQLANAGSAKLFSAGAPVQVPFAIVAEALAVASPVRIVVANLSRLRWTPPPGLTPVSLKVRLLN
jgi:hypothetical protein